MLSIFAIGFLYVIALINAINLVIVIAQLTGKRMFTS